MYEGPVRQIPVLLGGEPDSLKAWAPRQEARRGLGYVEIIIAGAGPYGAAMGSWRSPLQAAYNLVQVTQVILIALAGVAATVRLLRLLQARAGSDRVARKVLLAWLSGDLFLGSQLCWILRPFIGSPGSPVAFIRPNALRGNFYEMVFRPTSHLLSF